MLAEAVAVGFSAEVWPDDGAVGVGWGHNQNIDAAMDAPTTQPTMKKVPSRRAVNRGGVIAGGEGTCEEGMSWPSSGVVALVTAAGSSTKIGCVTGELQCGAGFDVSDCHKVCTHFQSTGERFAYIRYVGRGGKNAEFVIRWKSRAT